jgi:hypothetical protein
MTRFDEALPVEPRDSGVHVAFFRGWRHVFPFLDQFLQFFRHQETETEKGLKINRDTANAFVVTQDELNFLRGLAVHRDHL